MSDHVLALDGRLNGLTQALAKWRTEMGADPRHRDRHVLMSRLMGIVSECAEAYEAVRIDDPSNLIEEMADIFIRWAGLIGFLNIDIEEAIATKMRTNLFSSEREAM